MIIRTRSTASLRDSGQISRQLQVSEASIKRIYFYAALKESYSSKDSPSCHGGRPDY